jgi:hypothetical protein
MAKPASSSKARSKSRPRKLASRGKCLTAEEKAFLDTLAANKQVQTGRGKLKAGVTHTVERTPSGVVLRRKRFSAV